MFINTNSYLVFYTLLFNIIWPRNEPNLFQFFRLWFLSTTSILSGNSIFIAVRLGIMKVFLLIVFPLFFHVGILEITMEMPPCDKLRQYYKMTRG